MNKHANINSKKQLNKAEQCCFGMHGACVLSKQIAYYNRANAPTIHCQDITT